MKEVVDFPRNPCVLPVHRQLPEKPAISTSAEEEVEKKGWESGWFTGISPDFWYKVDPYHL